MKKFLSVLLACMMLVCVFSACGGDDAAETTVETADETVADTTVADTTVADTTVADTTVADTTAEVADVADDNVIVMATNAFFQPYEYYEGEKIVGIDAEIAAAIAEKLGKVLVISDMEFGSIITAVMAGEADFGMAGMTVTEERLQSINFSSSYANGVQSIIVKEGSAIASVDDLYAEGVTYKVGVQLATTGDIYASDDFGDENVQRYSNGSEAVLALVGGDVDCVIIDNEPAKALVAENEGLVLLDTAYADEDYAICVAKENTELLDAINVAIDELTADGTIDTIVAKYIK